MKGLKILASGVVLCFVAMLSACGEDEQSLLIEKIKQNPSVYKYSFVPSVKDKHLLLVYYFSNVDKNGALSKLARWKVVPKASEHEFLKLPESTITIEFGDGYFEKPGTPFQDYFQTRTFKFMGWEQTGFFDKFEVSHGAGVVQEDELIILFSCFKNSGEIINKIINITYNTKAFEKHFFKCNMVNSKTGSRVYVLVTGLLLDKKTLEDLNLMQGSK